MEQYCEVDKSVASEINLKGRYLQKFLTDEILCQSLVNPVHYTMYII